MIIFVQIDSTTGNGLGPNFAISSNIGQVSPNTATRQELLNGVYLTVNDASTKITLTSQGNCTNSITVDITNLPFTPTTTSTSCVYTGGGTAIYVVTESTTLPGGGEVLSNLDVDVLREDNSIIVRVSRVLGAGPNILTFTGTVAQYINSDCTSIAGTYTFQITLVPTEIEDTFVLSTANLSLNAAKIISLSVNGDLIGSSSELVNVSGNLYLISGYGVCLNI
jgi:hypothetical protein